MIRKKLKMHDSQKNKEVEYDEILTQLKEKHAFSRNANKKIMISTILPKSWSVKRIEEEFQTTRYAAELSKKLVCEKGILSKPDPKKNMALLKKFKIW